MGNPTILYNKSTRTLTFGKDIGDDAARYTAISHTWSMWNDSSKDILGIENGFLKGTADFNSMLHFVDTEWIWIDTLCIKDNNKENEIPNMGEYYKNAQPVLVVLDTIQGEYDLGTLKIDNFEHRMNSNERVLMLNSCPEDVAVKCALSESGVAVYRTLCTMFKAEWFKRGWTLQELLLSESAIMWNGFSHVDVADVRRCIDWLGTVLPDVLKCGLENDDDYNSLQRIFHTYSMGMPYEIVDELMSGRRCTKKEDYVYCVLGLLGTQITIKYNVSLQVCKRRLFAKLIQEQRAACLFTHTGVGILPVNSDYGTSISNDNPRCDYAVYSMHKKGASFSNCRVYAYDIAGIITSRVIDTDYPERNIQTIVQAIGNNVQGYKDLVKAMYSTTGTDDDEFIINKSEWFMSIRKSFAIDARSFDAQQNFDCIRLHQLLTSCSTPFVSYGLVHNNTSVCAYTFACLEAIPRNRACLLLAPGIVGDIRETGILCSGTDPYKNTLRKIGVTLNLGKHNLGTIEPITSLPEVIIAANKTTCCACVM